MPDLNFCQTNMGNAKCVEGRWVGGGIMRVTGSVAHVSCPNAPATNKESGSRLQ